MNALISLPIMGAMAIPTPSLQPTTLPDLFDEAVRALRSARLRLDRESDRVAILLAEETRHLGPKNQRSTEQVREYVEARIRIELREGLDELYEAHEAAYSRIDDLSERAGELHASSIGDLGIKARAAAIAGSHWWRKPINKLDYDAQHAVRLIEAVFTAAGLPPVREYLRDNIEALA